MSFLETSSSNWKPLTKGLPLNLNDMTHHDHPRNDLALAEAALFLAPQPLTRRGLAKILGGVAQAYVDQLLADLKEQFDDSSRGIELHIEDGRAQFRVKSAYVEEVAHLAPQHDIPRQELRTLAVIAYNHPMTQSNLIKVRGNKGYKHVQELIERNLITSEPHGRTCLLHVTRDFLRHFGLSSVDEFRFHFPTAAEENAEALARGGSVSNDDHTENLEDKTETDPEGNPIAHAESEDRSESQDPSDRVEEVSSAASEDGRDPEPLAANQPDNEDRDSIVSRVPFPISNDTIEAENGEEDEPDEEPAQEVEHG